MEDEEEKVVQEEKISCPSPSTRDRRGAEMRKGEVGARLRPTPQRDGQVAQAGQGPMRRPEEEEGRDSVSVRYDQTEER
ncbi:Catalase-peroxidase [Dissostichus eleginoides]|uniref:Catalase-peroxidase n=1 Tax=Dissostichus eleginoides TaxID=100907 RepID=A0AAD9FKG6_DISEL|nr:Catalase-peroxidase [Dissostichus eleginoides]